MNGEGQRDTVSHQQIDRKEQKRRGIICSVSFRNPQKPDRPISIPFSLSLPSQFGREIATSQVTFSSKLRSTGNILFRPVIGRATTFFPSWKGGSGARKRVFEYNCLKRHWVVIPLILVFSSHLSLLWICFKIDACMHRKADNRERERERRKEIYGDQICLRRISVSENSSTARRHFSLLKREEEIIISRSGDRGR